MTAEFWITQAFNGLSYGALLFLLASGLSLIFGVMRVVNLAHGSYFMLGGYVGLSVVWRTNSYALALVTGDISGEEGVIDAPLAKQPGTGGEKMYVDPVEGLPSKTRWRVIDRAGNRAAWVELQPLTGRTHQLRVHMAAIGHPIVGDAKYGGPDAFLTGGISRKLHLHARRLRIDAPGGGKIDVTADLPPHFAESLNMLGFETMAGDFMPMDNPPPSPEAKRRKVAAAAKTRRRERRGERRSRGSAPRGKGRK